MIVTMFTHQTGDRTSGSGAGDTVPGAPRLTVSVHIGTTLEVSE